MDVEKLPFDNVNLGKINHLLELENRFNWKPKEKGKRKTLFDFIEKKNPWDFDVAQYVEKIITYSIQTPKKAK